jgi:hypothetical protein
VIYRHVQQLSGNGREDGQKGKVQKKKSWDSEVVKLTEKWDQAAIICRRIIRRIIV